MQEEKEAPRESDPIISHVLSTFVPKNPVKIQKVLKMEVFSLDERSILSRAKRRRLLDGLLENSIDRIHELLWKLQELSVEKQLLDAQREEDDEELSQFNRFREMTGEVRSSRASHSNTRRRRRFELLESEHKEMVEANISNGVNEINLA